MPHLKLMKLVIIMPALNEERTIGSVISSIPRNVPHITTTEVMVIDDGSQDKTADMARAAGATVISHAQNQGVGAAFHTGLQAALEAGADVIVNIDSDGQFDPNDIPKLTAPILDGKAQFVSATRFAKKEFMPQMPAVKVWGNRWVTRLVNFITNKKFT